jgi:hypothetical protein
MGIRASIGRSYASAAARCCHVTLTGLPPRDSFARGADRAAADEARWRRIDVPWAIARTEAAADSRLLADAPSGGAFAPLGRVMYLLFVMGLDVKLSSDPAWAYFGAVIWTGRRSHPTEAFPVDATTIETTKIRFRR